MNQDFEKELQRAEREKARAQRVDSFWNAFQLTENGHVKSTLLLNSFCLSIVFLAVYFAAFYLLTDPIHALLSSAPLAVENLANALLPAIVGTAVCGLTHLFCHSGRHAADAARWGGNDSVSELLRHAGTCAADNRHCRFFVRPAPKRQPFTTYITEKAVKL